MRILRAAIATLVFLFLTSPAFCCSCGNSTPIQKTAARYQERAVFTAHVVQLIGNIYDWDGKRLSDRVLAVVHQRYWGMPWYWPKVVILDGSYPCDIAMAIGEDYLVSGMPERYGVLAVNMCSRTQPLQIAQLDLRTLDGSHCAVPGGTVIGHLLNWDDKVQHNRPAPYASVNLRDQNDKTYKVQSDGDGIYELRHLPPGIYVPESLFSHEHYASSGRIGVVEGLCAEFSILLRDYSVSGRLLPGLDASVQLIRAAQPGYVWRGTIEPDGRFYFSDVPDGEYVLSVTSSLQGSGRDLYYPGTFDRQKATRLAVANHVLVGRGALDFNPETLPMVPVPVALDPPRDSGRFDWRVQLLGSNYFVTETSWVAGAKFVFVYGMRGTTYDVVLYGWSTHPTEYGDCRSESAAVVAKPSMATIHMTIPPNCR